MSLTGKVALVTGAGQGLGKAFCQILLENGAKVCLTDINETIAQQTLSELGDAFGGSNVTFSKCDITNKQDLENAFSETKSKLGGIDIVINNAGIGIENEHWAKTIDVNVKGTLQGTVLALDHLRKDKGGRGGVIINIASMAGINPNPCGPVYGASKAAVIMFSQCWAMNPDVVSNGVRINVLAPAFAETPLFDNLRSEGNVHRPDIAAMIMSKVGLMSTRTVAEGCLELITDQTKHNAILKMSEVTGKVYHNPPQ